MSWADPYFTLSYQRLRFVATIRNCTRRTKLIFRNFTRVLTKTRTRWLFATFCHTRDFRRDRSTSDGHRYPMPTGTSFIPLDVLINCVSPCLMFLRLTVRCAAYAAWTRPGLVKTDKTCVKLTCLYQVRVFSRLNKQVPHLKLKSFPSGRFLWSLETGTVGDKPS